jgi:hypothetical protein
MSGGGLETRKEILPKPDVPQGPGVFGPSYSFADSVKLPGEIGVRDGNDMSSVMDSVKGVAYYVDTIGFGESSNPLTNGMDLKPIGVNYWLPTGFTCSNGAKMYQYNESIPKGDALGKKVDDGLRSAGLPRLRGLAPGIMEDAKSALNPIPIMQAVFGSGSPQCRYEMKPVGDQDGRLQNTAGEFYVEDPESVQEIGGRPHQGRWVFDRSLSQDQWDSAPKTHCPDGYPLKNHINLDCSAGLQTRSMEGFESYAAIVKQRQKVQRQILLGACVIGGLLWMKYKA